MPLTASQRATLNSTDLSSLSKTAVIVGGTTGIGGALSRSLAILGCQRIVVVGRDEGRGEAMVTTLEGISQRKEFEAKFVKGDVS